MKALNLERNQYPTRVVNLDNGIAHDGRTKKERYRWYDIEGVSKPMLLQIDSLNVDEYQRGEVSNTSTSEKAKNFSFEAAGAPIVGQRKDGGFWIVDGLQRVLALLKRGDTKKIYCMVFQSRGKSHEASVFYLCNIGRSRVQAIHKYKVAVASNFSPQAQIDEWLTKNGFVVANLDSQNTIRFITTIQQLWNICPESTKRALLFARNVGSGYMENIVFKGAATLIRKGIDVENYIDKIETMGGVPKIKQKINEIAILSGKDKNWNVCAKGLADILNYKVQEKNRINISLE